MNLHFLAPRYAELVLDSNGPLPADGVGALLRHVDASRPA